MVSTITKTGLFSAFTLGLVTLTTEIAFAASKCTLNGKEVDCAQLGETVKTFLGWGIGLFVVFAAIGLWAAIFWLLMLIHAATHEIENKAVWIILIIFTGIIGALIYYFMVKRPFNRRVVMPGTTPSTSAP